MSNATGATLMAAVESGSSGAEHSSMAGAHLECRLISISPRTACRNFWRERNLDPRFRWSCSSGWVGDWGWELILILALDFVATFLSIRVLFLKKSSQMFGIFNKTNLSSFERFFVFDASFSHLYPYLIELSTKSFCLLYSHQKIWQTLTQAMARCQTCT